MHYVRTNTSLTHARNFFLPHFSVASVLCDGRARHNVGQWHATEVADLLRLPV